MKKTDILLVAFVFAVLAFAQDKPAPQPPTPPVPPKTEVVQTKDAASTLQLIQALAKINAVNTEAQKYIQSPEYQAVAKKIASYREEEASDQKDAQALEDKIKKSEGWDKSYSFDPQKDQWVHIVTDKK